MKSTGAWPDRIIAALLLGLALAAAGSGTARAQEAFATFRYDDDVSRFAGPSARQDIYAQLKYIPLGKSNAGYLSFGGELRERSESVQDGILGFGKIASNNYGSTAASA